MRWLTCWGALCCFAIARIPHMALVGGDASTRPYPPAANHLYHTMGQGTTHAVAVWSQVAAHAQQFTHAELLAAMQAAARLLSAPAAAAAAATGEGGGDRASSTLALLNKRFTEVGACYKGWGMLLCCMVNRHQASTVPACVPCPAMQQQAAEGMPPSPPPQASRRIGALHLACNTTMCTYAACSSWPPQPLSLLLLMLVRLLLLLVLLCAHTRCGTRPLRPCCCPC
jgi:hypothetical protein